MSLQSTVITIQYLESIVLVQYVKVVLYKVRNHIFPGSGKLDINVV